jgi:hypothetical protein
MIVKSGIEIWSSLQVIQATGGVNSTLRWCACITWRLDPVPRFKIFYFFFFGGMIIRTRPLAAFGSSSFSAFPALEERAVIMLLSVS